MFVWNVQIEFWDGALNTNIAYPVNMRRDGGILSNFFFEITALFVLMFLCTPIEFVASLTKLFL